MLHIETPVKLKVTGQRQLSSRLDCRGATHAVRRDFLSHHLLQLYDDHVRPRKHASSAFEAQLEPRFEADCHCQGCACLVGRRLRRRCALDAVAGVSLHTGQVEPAVVLWASGRLGLRISNAASCGVAAGIEGYDVAEHQHAGTRSIDLAGFRCNRDVHMCILRGLTYSERRCIEELSSLSGLRGGRRAVRHTGGKHVQHASNP